MRQGCEKVFKKQADNEQQAALELTPKAQVSQGRGIQRHFEIQSLGNSISRGFQEVFSIPHAKFFRCNTHNTGNNAVKMSQVFHNMAQFKCFTGLTCVQCHSKLGNGYFTMLFDGASFLLAVMVEGDESSRLKMANQPAVLAGYWPLLTPLSIATLRTRTGLYLGTSRNELE